MKVYKVGGAVRDRLLGRPIKERDYVVVGASPEMLLAQGFKPVGKDFPVFLHPVSHEEYALARTERKTGPGYRGFNCYAAPDVSLEDDLKRRDLTINAIAENASGELIDPYGGCADLERKILRHISSAFKEDPVRILRVARFMARFADQGFTVANETLVLMQNMVQEGEASALVAERVWREFAIALTEPSPQAFIETLQTCGALAVIFPELSDLFNRKLLCMHNVTTVNIGEQALKNLVQATQLTIDPVVRFAALMLYIGVKSTYDFTPSREHMLRTIVKRWRLPSAYPDLLILSARYHQVCHRLFELEPTEMLQLLEQLDAFRRPKRLEAFLTVCKASWLACNNHEVANYNQYSFLLHILKGVNQVKVSALVAEGFQGSALGEQLRSARLIALKSSLAQNVNKK